MAMTELGSYYVSLVPTAHNITGHISRQFAPAQGIAASAGDEAGGRFSGAFGKSVSGVGHALSSALKAGVAVAGTAVVAAGAVGIKTAAQLENANIAFTTMLGSGEKARSFLGELKSFAAKTPFDLPGLQTAASSLISIGLDSKKVIPIMTTLGNVTSGMGTGAEGIKRATTALQQMNASGKISAEDLNQLRDAGVPVFELLTAATGKTTAEIAEMRDKGKLGREELEALMSALETGKGFERFNGLMDAQSQSLGGLWSTLKDTFSVGMAEAIEPALPIIKAGMGGTISWLSDTAIPKLQGALKDGVGGLHSFANAWKYNDGDITSDGWHGKVEAFAFWLHQLWDRIQTVDFSSLQGFFGSLGNLGPSFSSIASSAQTLAPAMGEFLRSVVSAAPEGMAVGMELLAGALGFLAGHVDWIVAHMPLLVAGFVAWRVAQMGVNILTAASIPLMIAANTARTAAAVAEYRLAVAQRVNTAAGVANVGVQQTSTIAAARHAVASGAHAAATTAQTAATRIATGAQWLWNASMHAFPLILIIAGIAAVVAGIVWFATQTDAGRAMVAAAWGGIQWAIQGVVNFWNGVVVPAAQWVFGLIGQAAMWLWNNVMVPAWTGIQNAANAVFTWFQVVALPLFQGAMAVLGAVGTWLWLNVLQPAFAGIAFAIGVAWAIIKGYFDAWVWIYQNILAPVIMWLWESILGPAFHLMSEAVKLWWNITQFFFQAFWAIITNVIGPVIGWLWNNVAIPAFEGIGAVIGFMWNVLVKPIFDLIVGFIRLILAVAFLFLWEGIVKPVFEGIAAVIGWAWNTIISPIWNAIVAFMRDTLGPPFNVLAALVGAAWDRIAGGISSTWDWIKTNVLNPLIGFITVDVPNAFSDGAKFIGEKWDALKGIAKAPIVWIIDEVINKGVIGTFNTVADFLKIDKIPPVKKPDGWAHGGHTGPGGKYEPAGIVHRDEYVVQKESQRAFSKKYGMETLDYINAYGDLPPQLADNRYWGEDHEIYRKPGSAGGGPGTPVWGGMKSFNNLLQAEIFKDRHLNVKTIGHVDSKWRVRDAAAQWNGLANVDVGVNGGGPTVELRQQDLPEAWWAGVYWKGNEIGLANSMVGRLGADGGRHIVAHEIGHALGLPHPHEPGGNNATSIMNYNTDKVPGPTAADKAMLNAIYPGAAKGVNGGASEGNNSGSGSNPFDTIVEGLGDMVKKVFPAGGKFVDMAVGTVKKIMAEMGAWLLDKLGGIWDFLSNLGGSDSSDNADINGVAKEALERTKSFTPENMAALMHRINQESGGDPRAINNWDSNAALGTPTKGLMQLLDSNFQQYRDNLLPNDIFHPLANVVAGIKYTKGRFPSRSMESVWRQPGGYAKGGLVEFDHGGMLEMGMPAIHRKKKPDAVLTPAEWDAMYGIAEAAGDNDGGRIDLHVHGDGMSEEMVGEIAARKIMRRRGRR